MSTSESLGMDVTPSLKLAVRPHLEPQAHIDVDAVCAGADHAAREAFVAGEPHVDVVALQERRRLR